MKTKLTALILVLWLAFFTACQSEGTQGFDIPIFKQAPIQYERSAVSPETEYPKNTVIFTGTVINVRETTLNYEYLGAKVSDPVTFFDVELSDVLSCRSGSYASGDVVTVGVGYNTSS